MEQNVDVQRAVDQIQYLQQLIQQTRARFAMGYPHLFLWGVAWVLGYLGTAYLSGPAQAWTWPVVLLGASVIGAVIGTKSGNDAANSGLLKQVGWMALLLFFAGVAMLILFGKNDPHVINAFFPFWIGTIYAVSGLFIGREGITIGIGLIAIAIASLSMPLQTQEIWLGAVGGGGLILSGWLCRRSVSG